MTYFHTLIDFESVARVWSGLGDLSFMGRTWIGVGNFFSVSPVETSTSRPGARARIAFSLSEPERVAAESGRNLREELFRDHGPLMITIRQIFSTDGGNTWRAIPATFTGFLSSTEYDSAGLYVAEIETWTGDVDRGRPLRWSAEDHRARFPGPPPDDGLFHMRTLSEGINQKWPPID